MNYLIRRIVIIVVFVIIGAVIGFSRSGNSSEETATETYTEPSTRAVLIPDDDGGYDATVETYTTEPGSGE